MKVINATGVKSKAGTIVKISADKEKLSFTLVGVGHQSNAFVVVDDGVPDGKPCEITNTGVSKVLVSGNFRAGDVVRSRKKGDKDLSGAGFKASDDTVPYLQIGCVITPVRNGLADVWLDIKYVATNSSGSYVFGSSPNYSVFEDDGTLWSYGTATGWDDLRAPATGINPLGSTSPATPNTTDGSLTFAKGNAITAWFQLPHSWEEGTEVSPHIHWSKTTTNAGTVNWQMKYKWFNIGDVDPGFSSLATGTETVASGNIVGKHALLEFADIAGTGKTFSSMLCLYIERVSSGDTHTGDVNLYEVDVHYKINSFGTRNEYA